MTQTTPLGKKDYWGGEPLFFRSIFLFGVGKLELGEEGMNYSVTEFCCKKK